MPEISMVLPAYNESGRLEKTVGRTAGALEAIGTFEIIIAEDGSRDGTDRIASGLAGKYPYVKHLHSDERLGRGRALTRAFKMARGDVLAYIDVDLATDMSHLSTLINSISKDGYDFSTGSRMLPESSVRRPLKRGIASRGFNFLTRTLLGSKLHDHQCGFKAFSREPLFRILDGIHDQHWFWDTELLVRAQRAGYRVKEFPVRWEHGGATTVNMKRDVIGMGSQILRLWWEFRQAKT